MCNTPAKHQHRASLLDRCVKRLEWEQAQEKEAAAAADEAEKERIAMQQIDWYVHMIVVHAGGSHASHTTTHPGMTFSL